MATEWVTVTDAKAAVGLDPADERDDDWLTKAVRAVNQYVDDTRETPPPGELDDRTKLGALNLVARWYSRRNSDQVAQFIESGGAVPPLDRDVEMQLQIGRYAPPVVA